MWYVVAFLAGLLIGVLVTMFLVYTLYGIGAE